MDARYCIVNDCLNALRATALPHLRRQLELEVKLLKLRVELLKNESAWGRVHDTASFEDLQQLVQVFVAYRQSEDACREIVWLVDDLFTQVRAQAAEHALIAGTTPFLGDVSPSLQPPGARRP
ncbi:hypothetical protein M1B72_09170 [Geomonas paludis]|uniref:Transposase n=1 Tax=Geomonas paludis TaxID=2740185 RepID=A0ABY4LK07_9BACT|nr:hypothetical protein [Geomonas paludis]UPU37860.1 hypothetical protein M1B72_09170 [Geomonas paludis]